MLSPFLGAQAVLDHPSPEPDGTLGRYPHFALAKVLQVILHFGRKEVRAYPEPSLDSQRMVAHPDLWGIHSAVDDPNQDTVHLSDQAIVVPNPVAIPPQELRIHPDPNDVIIVPGYVQGWLYGLEERRNGFSCDLMDHHLLSSCQSNCLWGIRRHVGFRWS